MPEAFYVSKKGRLLLYYAGYTVQQEVGLVEKRCDWGFIDDWRYKIGRQGNHQNRHDHKQREHPKESAQQAYRAACKAVKPAQHRKRRRIIERVDEQRNHDTRNEVDDQK